MVLTVLETQRGSVNIHAVGSGGGDSREDVVQGEIRELRERRDAAERVGVVGVHERVDERLVRAERTADLDGVVVGEVTTARELYAGRQCQSQIWGVILSPHAATRMRASGGREAMVKRTLSWISMRVSRERELNTPK